MRRVYPGRIRDKFELSMLLQQYLDALFNAPLETNMRSLCHDTRIPESVIKRLLELKNYPEDSNNILAEDYHVVFSNIMFRYPTLKIWQTKTGELFFEY